MKQKEVEDVFGGQEEKNADSMASMLLVDIVNADAMHAEAYLCVSSSMPRGRLQRGTGVLFPVADSQCGRADDYFPQGWFQSRDLF